MQTTPYVQNGAINENSANPPVVGNQLNSLDQQVQSVAVKKLCDCCSKPASLSCSRCQRVYYCLAACQATAWKTHHKSICVPLAQPEKYTTLNPQGLTPLHYAVLYGKEKTLTSEQQAQLQTVKDSFNGTAEDLKSYMAPVSEGVISLQMMTSDRQAISLTQAEFLQRTGVRFKDGYVASREVLLRFHSNPKQFETTPWMIAHDHLQVAKFEKKPPVVFLVEEPSMGLGLQAGQDIKEGEIICCFGGEWTLEASKTYRAQMYEIRNGADQDRFSGLGVFINDGPPNCIFNHIKNYKGLPRYPIIQAARDIKKGELLHATYGSDHGLRGGKYAISEQSYQEIVNYCQSGHFYQPLTNKSNRYQEGLLEYIWDVSHLFILLHLQEVLNIAKTKALMQRPDVKHNLALRTPTFYPFYPQLLDVIAKIHALNAKDHSIISLVAGLSKTLSQRAFVQMLLLMEEEPSLSAASISHYLTLGNLYDHLYLVLNGTLNGTYLDKTKGPGQEKKPNFPLDYPLIKTHYSSLTPHLKINFKEQVFMCSMHVQKKKLLDKKKAFDALLLSLERMK